MLHTDVQHRILKAVDDAFDRQIAFTQSLIGFPSQRGHEQSAQAFMAQAFSERGLDVDHFKIDIDTIRDLRGFSPVHVNYDEAYNVVGAYRASAGAQGRSLILNGHIDVVPTGPLEGWHQDPYDARVEGNWLYGRGSGDMKSGLVATVFAFDAVRAAGFDPAGDVYLQSVVEEECTGNGALACVARGYQADCAFIPEPFGPRLMRAQVGPMWLKVRVLGDPQHASGFQAGGANAIEKGMFLWTKFKELEVLWNERRKDYPLFAEVPHPIRFNLGKIAGGDWVSSVPAWCELEIRVGVYPGQALADARNEIEAFLAEVSRQDAFLKHCPPTITYHGFMAEGYVLENAQEPEAVLRDSHFSVYGEPLLEHVTPAATDIRFFGINQNTPGLVYGPICEGAHAYDERVDLDSVRGVTKTIALFIASWCGVIPRV